MRCTIGQINTTPNDFDGNYAQIEFGIKKAMEDDSDLVVFPELSIPGYLIEDLIYTKGFVEKNYDYLDKIRAITKRNKKLHVVVGYVDKNTTGSGKPFYNSCAIINNGHIIAKYNKFAPVYSDVFYEERFYEPGKDICILNIAGKRVGFVICHDSWLDRGQTDFTHHVNPLQLYRDNKVDWIVSINASPYYINKTDVRLKMYSEVCKDSFGLIWVNMYASNDQIIFDGHSFVMNKNGTLVDYLKNDFIPAQNPLAKGAKGQYKTIDTEKLCYVDRHENNPDISMVMLGLFDYVKKSGFKEVCFGNSGGIDSCVVLALASICLGGEHIHAIMMPSIYSSEGSVSDATLLSDNFGTKKYLVPIEHVKAIEHMNTCLGLTKYNEVADQNYQARIRSMTSLHLSNAMGYLALNTSNKTELSTGYFSLGEIASFDVIGDLYKGEVYSFANRINEYFGKEMIPKSIINKHASAELKPGEHKDEDSLMPYEILDEICKAYIEDNISDIDMFKEYMKTENKYHIVEKHNKVLEERYYKMVRLIDNMEFKRRLSPLCPKIHIKAFGIGRRIPVVKG